MNKVLNFLMWFCQVLGTAICILAVMRVFGVGSNLITSDKAWLLMLFGGMGISCIGFFLDSYLQVAFSEHFKQVRKQGMRGMAIASTGCFFLTYLVYAYL